jgi:hypothetical protein
LVRDLATFFSAGAGAAFGSAALGAAFLAMGDYPPVEIAASPGTNQSVSPP